MARQAQDLEKLAMDPGLAHLEWSRLAWYEQISVVLRMIQRFKPDFALAFHEIAGKGHAMDIYLQPGSDFDPEAHGYRYAGMWHTGDEKKVLVWVHWDGRMIRQDVSSFVSEVRVEEIRVAEGRPIAPPSVTPPIQPPGENIKSAQDLLEVMQDSNRELVALCSIGPFQETDAANQMRAYIGAREILQSLIQSAGLSALGMSFRNQVDAEEKLNATLRQQCCMHHAKDPIFNCGPGLQPFEVKEEL